MAEAKGASSCLIVNPAAGSAAALLGSLIGAARERGMGVRVLEPSEDARLAALEAADVGAELLAVAGGDRTVAAVAGVAVERTLPLVVVPTGTLNHFARDLGLDLARPARALDAFDASHERGVDVGRVNGRPFVNNVSLGLYAEMLADPGYRQDKLGVAQRKLQAAFSDPGLRRMLRIAPPGEATLEGIVALVVSNNPYEFSRWDRLGQRNRLDTGTLQVSVLDASTLDELERLLAGTLLGAIELRSALRHWTSERLETGSLGEVVRAGVDGESRSPSRRRCASRWPPVGCACSCRKGFPWAGGCRRWGPGCTQPEACVAGCARSWCNIVGAMILKGRRHPI